MCRDGDPGAPGDDGALTVAVGADAERRADIEIEGAICPAAFEENGITRGCPADGMGDRGQGFGEGARGAVDAAGRHVPVTGTGRHRNHDGRCGQHRDLQYSDSDHQPPPIRGSTLAGSSP